MAITAARVATIVAKYGADASFRVCPEEVYDPTTGKVTRGEAVLYSHKVIEGSDSESFLRLDGVAEAELLLSLSPRGLEFTPVVGMEVIYDDKTWVIAVRNRVIYRGQVVLYELALNGPGQR